MGAVRDWLSLLRRRQVKDKKRRDLFIHLAHEAAVKTGRVVQEVTEQAGQTGWRWRQMSDEANAGLKSLRQMRFAVPPETHR